MKKRILEQAIEGTKKMEKKLFCRKFGMCPIEYLT